ncbi:predicted protein [Methanosarcina acetivorans C2A]|uniref:Uncharacterized protein n=1 Tax=Methanosarcina acetivorans (strain ATCC 35395 / DSM 2834 / JCM 12185 / C2A) TaxID=188937 RepID=Q8TMP5_METAC|nr:predicted protein [Methanosarcina acetivorans C2A]
MRGERFFSCFVDRDPGWDCTAHMTSPLVVMSWPAPWWMSPLESIFEAHLEQSLCPFIFGQVAGTNTCLHSSQSSCLWGQTIFLFMLPLPDGRPGRTEGIFRNGFLRVLLCR